MINNDERKESDDEPVELLPYTPETEEEAARSRGLAFSAAAFLVGAVVVMLFIGWLLDRYFGTAPGFLAGGIVLGAVIGFYQFFRLTSQIFRKD
jgi:F0F1-type ATP synthase assembly protein I